MAQAAKKKNSFPWLLFLIGFGVVFVIMFVNRAGSPVKIQLDAPIDGVDQLRTVGDDLFAISATGKTHIWKWRNLNTNPQYVDLQSQRAAPASDMRMIKVENARPEWVQVVDADGEPLNRFSVGYGRQCEYVTTSANGRFAALGVLSGGDTGDAEQGKEPIRLERYDFENEKLVYIAAVTPTDEPLQYRAVAVSNDGQYLACAGSRDQTGWMALADAEQKKILWQKSVDFSEELRVLAFAPDSKTVYCAGLGHQIQGYQCQDGETVGSWEFPVTEHVNVPQYTTDITVSDDGSVIAAGTEPAGSVYVWNLKTKRERDTIAPGHNILTGVAVSDDGGSLATGDMRTKTNKINIWEIQAAD